MKLVRCGVLPISFSLVAAVAGIAAGAPAQNQNATTDETKSINVSGPKKPVHKLNEVANTDPVVLLGVKRTAADAAENAKPEKSLAETAGPATSAERTAGAEGTEKKAAEIASLEKQIKDKMTRITLLMRLFVNDEKAFIVDPANPKGDEATQDRRRYEQDELLWETAELAKLKARLNKIAAAK